MTDQEKHQQLNFSNFDAMPTEKLEEILQLDANFPDKNLIDPDAILYILEVLARRENENGTAPDVESAWREFNEKYRPYSSDAASLYENSNLIDDAPAMEISGHQQNKPVRFWRKFTQTGFRLGFAAMIAVVILTAATATASALGYDIWNTLAKWTGEVFGFQSAVEQKKPTVARQLNELKQAMDEHGVTVDVLPSYLPEGYEVVSTQSWSEVEYIKFDCLLSNGEDSIILVYFLHLNDDYTNEFEKNLSNPESYDIGGVTHYLMDNIDTYFAAWQNGRMECSITGMNSKEEIIKIIDSIYGEET